jgi:hypothetical protein
VLNATQTPVDTADHRASTATMTYEDDAVSAPGPDAEPVPASVFAHQPDAEPEPDYRFEPEAPPPPGLPPYTPPEATGTEPIDWDRVSAERAARRQAEQSRHRRNLIGAALVGLGVLALLVGIATNRSNDGGDDDDDQASALSTTTTIESSSTDAPTTTLATATTGPGGATAVSVFELQPSMCINNPELSTGLVTDLSAVPCEQPHTHEVYFKVTYSPPDGAFDAQRVAAFADEQCAQAFTAYVGVPYDRSKYYFLHLAPSAESWKEQGDRDVVCLLFQQGASLTGSAKGSAQ